MSKEKERAHFEWQKSNNLYMFLLAIIIFLTSILGSLSGIAKIINLWVLSFCILFFGISIMIVNSSETIYSKKYLEDKRKKGSKKEKIFTWITFYFIWGVGILVSLLGIYLIGVLMGIFKIPVFN